MTNEEAIKEIQDASDYEVRHGDIEHHHEDIMRRVEAFEKAVNALQKEPVYFPPCVDCNTKMNEIREAYDNLKKQESCEDAVSREKVWYMITGGKYADESCEQFIDRLVEKLNDLPPVTPTHKASEWQQDHAILKAHSDGANEVIDRIKELRGDVSVLREERRAIECHCGCASDVADEVLELIDKLIAEVEGKDATERK